MTCPNCGSVNISVKDTMHGPDGKIYRRRRCNDCSMRFRSVEEIADDTEEFRQAYSNAVCSKSELMNLYKGIRKRGGNE
jgi:transcriptional regulator NrdR family protein